MTRDEDKSREQEMAAFARAFPAIAGRLAAPLLSPFVERIVEGIGVLADRVEHVLDGSAPRAAVHVADVLFPELLRPFPASSIVEIRPTAARERQELGDGREFASVALDGTRCRFRAHAPLRIDPWRVDDARVAFSRTRGQSIEITLSPVDARQVDEASAPVLPLRLYVGGEPRAALSLVASLHESLAGIEFEIGGRVSELNVSSLRPWGFRADEALLPPDPLEHPGYRLVREFLVLPAKFAFVEIEGEAPVPRAGERVVMRLRFESPLPAGVQVTRETFRTNCIPVTNAFATTTEPLRTTLDRPSHVLRPAGLPPAHGDVYAVRRVRATLENGHVEEVPEAAAFGRDASAEGSGIGYVLRRTPGATGKGADLRLELEYASDCGAVPDARVLSVDVWATNRALPNTLGLGEIRLATPLSPSGCTFENITAVTPCRAAPDGVDLRWRTLALLALTARPLARADSIRTLLHALNLHRTADRQAARAHAQRLESVRSASARASTTSLSRGIARGTDILIELVERGFDGDGEAYVFARVLAHLFAHEASLNTFTRTLVRHSDTGREYSFPPLNGDREVG